MTGLPRAKYMSSWASRSRSKTRRRRLRSWPAGRRTRCGPCRGCPGTSAAGRRRVRVRVPVVADEEVAPRVRRAARRRRSRCAAAWNGKSITAWTLSCVVKCDVKVFVVSNTSPNMRNSDVPSRVRMGEHLRREVLPELVVDVLHRVDAEAVDLEVGDPILVDLHHPVDDALVLGEQVVEADEVAVAGSSADERRVAAVVVERDVVEPLGHLVLRAGARPAGLTACTGSSSSGSSAREVPVPAKSRSSNGLPARRCTGPRP